MMISEFLSHKQVVVSSLILQNYKKLGLNEKELIAYLLLLIDEKDGLVRLDLTMMSQAMDISIEAMYQLISQMEHKGLIQMSSQQTIDGKVDDCYSILPIYKKLESLMMQKTAPQQQEVTNHLVMKLEQEWARPLSSYNLRQIDQWINERHYNESLILLAFKRALQVNASNPFQYANRILESWRAQNITTEEDAMKDIRKNSKNRENQWIEQAQNNQNSMKIPIIKEWK